MKKLTHTILIFLMVILSNSFLQAQMNYALKGTPTIKISGTSTLHDWDMKSSTAICNASFVVNAANQITGLNAIYFSTPVDNLKSGKGAMDKNAYKALNKDKFPNITFALTPGTAIITSRPGGLFTVKCRGKLSIGGGVVETDLEADCKANADKSISVTGSKKISMKDYGVKPPTFMMGAIKTGNDIVLDFSLLMK